MSALSVTEGKDLARLEQAVTDNLDAYQEVAEVVIALCAEERFKRFVQAGRALGEICQRKLYRCSHKNFAGYCKEKWGIVRSTAYRAINSAIVVDSSPMGDKKPKNERQARELSGKTPKAQQQALEQASAGGRTTAAVLREQLDRIESEERAAMGTQPARAPRQKDHLKAFQGFMDKAVFYLDKATKELAGDVDYADERDEIVKKMLEMAPAARDYVPVTETVARAA